MDHPVSTAAVLAARRRTWVLAAVCMAAVALPLSFSGGAVATPAIGRDLHGSPVAMNWITNAFMLAFGSFLMASGALADQFGRKRLFAIGVGGFTLMSVALAFAPSILAVDLLRAAQGSRRPRRWPAARPRSRRNSTARRARVRSACSARRSGSGSRSGRCSPAG